MDKRLCFGQSLIKFPKPHGIYDVIPVRRVVHLHFCPQIFLIDSICLSRFRKNITKSFIVTATSSRHHERQHQCGDDDPVLASIRLPSNRDLLKNLFHRSFLAYRRKKKLQKQTFVTDWSISSQREHQLRRRY